MRIGNECIVDADCGGGGVCGIPASCNTYGLSGNIRLQVGDGLPVPGTLFQAAPDGKIVVQPAATVVQTTGVDPKMMIFRPDGIRQAARANNLGVLPFNAAVMQVKTEITFHIPGPYVLRPGAVPTVTNQPPPQTPANLAGFGVFQKNGRTGAPTMTFCAGTIVAKTAAANPMCAAPALGQINGLMKYTKLKNQFGGTMQFGEPTKDFFTKQTMASPPQQTVNVALNGGGGAPNCKYASGADPTCKAIFAFASVAVTGAQGATAGFANTTPGGTPTANIGRVFVSVNGLGSITATNGVTNVTTPKPGLPNAATSFGGPWTTGRLKVSVTNAVPPNPLEQFTLTGSDARSNGVGTISLVTGAMADRAVSGSNANRGWINFCVGAPNGVDCPQFTVPTMGTHGLVALMGLIALAGGYMLRRRLSGSSS